MVKLLFALSALALLTVVSGALKWPSLKPTPKKYYLDDNTGLTSEDTETLGLPIVQIKETGTGTPVEVKDIRFSEKEGTRWVEVRVVLSKTEYIRIQRKAGDKENNGSVLKSGFAGNWTKVPYDKDYVPNDRPVRCIKDRCFYTPPAKKVNASV